MRYITLQQFADSVGVTKQNAHLWVQQGRIPGARRVTDAAGRTIAWKIPADAKRPDRLKPGPRSGEAS